MGIMEGRGWRIEDGGWHVETAITTSRRKFITQRRKDAKDEQTNGFDRKIGDGNPD
jgi:hypothetical protein